MKKVLALITSLLYLAVTSGLALEIHHCMGEVAKVSLVSDGSSTCGKCGMEKGENACCKDESRFVKLQDSHKLADTGYQLFSPQLSLRPDYGLAVVSFLPASSSIESRSNAPPGNSGTALHIMHCVFRI